MSNTWSLTGNVLSNTGHRAVGLGPRAAGPGLGMAWTPGPGPRGRDLGPGPWMALGPGPWAPGPAGPGPGPWMALGPGPRARASLDQEESLTLLRKLLSLDAHSNAYATSDTFVG